MHAEALDWVRRHATSDPVSVLDLGGRDINGTSRSLFPRADYTVLDVADGAGVDIVADAATWTPDRAWDVVVCTEVFEHTPVWPAICRTAYAALRPGGRFIATMAGPGRPPHSAVDGGWRLHASEHYRNIEPTELKAALDECGFVDIEIDQRPRPADVRAAATRTESATRRKVQP